MKAVTHALALLGGERPSAVVTAFFVSDMTVLRTIARVQPDCAEEKGTRYDYV